MTYIAVHHHTPLSPVPEVVVFQDVLELDGEVSPVQGRVDVEMDRPDVGESDLSQLGDISLLTERFQCQSAQHSYISTLK